MYNHVYSVLNAFEIELDDQIKERVVQLRNPWRKAGCFGELATQSQKLDEIVLKKHNSNVLKDNATFWITINALQKNFQNLTVCMYHPNYEFSSLKIKQKSQHPQNVSMVKIIVKETQDIYISITQKDERHFIKKSSPSNYQYSLM